MTPKASARDRLSSLCLYSLTFVLLVITANVALLSGPTSGVTAAPMYDRGPRYRIPNDRRRLEGLAARLQHRAENDVDPGGARVYPVIEPSGMAVEHAQTHGQSAKVVAYLDKVRQMDPSRLFEDAVSSRLDGISWLDNAPRPYKMDVPELRMG